MVNSKVCFDAVGIEESMLMFPLSGAYGRSERLVEHFWVEVGGGSELSVALAEFGGLGFDGISHRSGRFRIFVSDENRGEKGMNRCR